MPKKRWLYFQTPRFILLCLKSIHAFSSSEEANAPATSPRLKYEINYFIYLFLFYSSFLLKSDTSLNVPVSLPCLMWRATGFRPAGERQRCSKRFRVAIDYQRPPPIRRRKLESRDDRASLLNVKNMANLRRRSFKWSCPAIQFCRSRKREKKRKPYNVAWKRA